MVGSADALNVGGGNSQTVGLQSGGGRKIDGLTAADGNGIGKSEGGSGQAAEINVAAEIELENLRFSGAQLNQVYVATHLESVLAAQQRDVIGEFGAALDAIDGGVRLAAEISEAGNVDADVGAAGQIRKTEVQAAARVLEAKFVEIAGR